VSLPIAGLAGQIALGIHPWRTGDPTPGVVALAAGSLAFAIDRNLAHRLSLALVRSFSPVDVCLGISFIGVTFV
jgi:hypothetical protein